MGDASLLKKHLSPPLLAFLFLVILAGLALDSVIVAALGVKGFTADIILQLCLDFVMGAALTTLIVWWVGSRVVAGATNPIERAHQVVKTLAQGDLSERMPVERGQLLEKFCEDLNYAAANLREYVAEDRFRLQHAAELLRSLARSHPEIGEDVENLIHGTLAKITKKLVLEEGDQGPDLSTVATGVYRGLKRQNVSG